MSILEKMCFRGTHALGGVKHFDCTFNYENFVSLSPAKYVHIHTYILPIVNMPNRKGSSSISLPSVHFLYTLTVGGQL